MTLTETRPDATDKTAPASPTGLEAWLSASDHKAVGRLYLLFGSLFAAIAVVISFVINIDRIDLSEFVIARDLGEVVQIWSAGRVLFFVGGIMPLLVGLGVYLVPLQIGSSAIAFGRGVAAAFWTWLLSASLLGLSYIVNGGPAGGATDAVELWALSAIVALGALCWALVAVATSVITLRAPGMSLARVPATAWSYLLFGMMSLLVLPTVMAYLLLAFLDTKYGWVAGIEARADYVDIFDRVSLAPAVYLLLIPTFGIVCDVVATMTGRSVGLHRSMLGAIGGIAVLSFGVALLGPAWDSTPVTDDNGLLVVVLFLAVLPVVSLLGLCGSPLRNGKFTMRTPLLAALLAGLVGLLAVVMGAVSQIAPALLLIEDAFNTDVLVPEGLTVWDTTYGEGMRVLVIGAASLAVIAGIHLWSIKIWGRTMAEGLGVLSALGVAVGSIVWGAGEIISGMLEQPAMPAISSDVDDWVEVLNAVSAVGSAILAGGVGVLALNIFMTMVLKAGSAAEPWRGSTLEWATLSPPPLGNFTEGPPPVNSAAPLADLAAENETTEEEG